MITGQAGASANCTQQETGSWERFSLKIFGDVTPDDSEEFPQNFDDAVAMMNRVPQLVKRYNEGKGKPLTYIMLPISRLAAGIPSKRLKTFRSVDDNWTTKIVRIFDQINDIRQKVYDQIEDLNNHSDRITAKELEQARLFATFFEDHQASVKCELAQLLGKILSANEDANCLDAFCDKHYQTAQDKFLEFRKFSEALEARICRPLRSTSLHLSQSQLAMLSQ